MANVENTESPCAYRAATSEILSIMFGFGIGAHTPLEAIELIGEQVFPLYSKEAEKLGEIFDAERQPAEAD